jgi:hypothetical protein
MDFVLLDQINPLLFMNSCLMDLEKFILSKEGGVNLSYKRINDIPVGVARGIAYLHHGCEVICSLPNFNCSLLTEKTKMPLCELPHASINST